MKPPRPEPPKPRGAPVGDDTLASPVESAEALQARVEALAHLVPGPKRSWSPSPPSNVAPPTVPTSEAERSYYAEKARRKELEAELARRPRAPGSDPPAPFSVSKEGVRFSWPGIKRYAPWVLTALAGGGGAAAREQVLDFLGVASSARLATEEAARRDLERKLSEELALRAAGDVKNSKDQREHALWLYGLLPRLGVKATLPKGEPEPEPLKMLPAPAQAGRKAGARIVDGPGAAPAIQPADPLPVPAAP